MPLRPFSFGGTPRSPGAAVFVSSCPRSNNNLSNTKSRLDTPLYSSVLDYALTLSEGLHAVRFPGTGYTGTDLPNSSYMYSSATISVRSTGEIATVLLFGISKSCPLAVNSCENGKWKGWDQYVTKDDLPNIFTNRLGTSNEEGNHVTTIKNLWSSFPERQVFACNIVDANNFGAFGFVYGNHKYGAVLYLAHNSCGIVRCNAGNFSDITL